MPLRAFAYSSLPLANISSGDCLLQDHPIETLLPVLTRPGDKGVRSGEIKGPRQKVLKFYIAPYRKKRRNTISRIQKNKNMKEVAVIVAQLSMARVEHAFELK